MSNRHGYPEGTQVYSQAAQIYSQGGQVVVPNQRPQLVRWGSVFSGTLVGVSTFALLTGLWLALSFGSRVSVVYSNLPWWVGGTAIFCMLLAGMVAGVTSGARGAGAGSMGGLTTWALVLVGAGMLVLPAFSIGHVPNTIAVSGHVYTINYLTYWTAFWTMLIGLAAAVLGGAIGGTVQRSVDEPYLDLTRGATVTGQPAVEPTVVAPSGVPAQP